MTLSVLFLAGVLASGLDEAHQSYAEGERFFSQLLASPSGQSDSRTQLAAKLMMRGDVVEASKLWVAETLADIEQLPSHKDKAHELALARDTNNQGVCAFLISQTAQPPAVIDLALKTANQSFESAYQQFAKSDDCKLQETATLYNSFLTRQAQGKEGAAERRLAHANKERRQLAPALIDGILP
ncbi:MAG TPA: hypothetical protein V6C72_07835, partial [Chroococcales cyanobacterium]